MTYKKINQFKTEKVQLNCTKICLCLCFLSQVILISVNCIQWMTRIRATKKYTNVSLHMEIFIENPISHTLQNIYIVLFFCVPFVIVLLGYSLLVNLFRILEDVYCVSKKDYWKCSCNRDKISLTSPISTFIKCSMILRKGVKITKIVIIHIKVHQCLKIRYLN